MTRRRWRWLLVVALLVVIPPALLVVFVHLPAVQRRAFDRATEALSRSTGLRLEAVDVGLRLWPARVEAEGLRLDAGDRTVATLDRLRATWRWAGLLGDTPRVESVELEGLGVDLRELPELPERQPRPGDRPVDPWRVVELGRLRLEGGEVAAAFGGLGLDARGVKLSGALESGRAGLRVAALELEVEREGRRLGLGPLELEARGDADGITVERCRLDGEVASLEAAGTAVVAETGVAAEARLQAGGDLEALVGWWDPELVPTLAPRGRVQLEGSGSVGPGGRLEAEVEHRGAPFEVAGYGVDRLRLTASGGAVRVELGGEGWGGADLDLTADRRLRVAARLDRAPLDPALAFAPEGVGAAIPRPLRLSGDVEVAVPLPPAVESLEARAALELDAPDLAARFAGRVSGRALEIEGFEVALPGAELHGEGSLRLGGEADLRLGIDVADPAALAGAVAPHLPVPLPVAVAGGPLTVEARVTGPLAMPHVSADLAWRTPEVDGHRVEEVSASVVGTLERLGWELEVEPVEGSRVGASGTAEPRAGRAAGEWLVEVPDLSTLAALVPATSDLPVGGSLRGGGGFLVGDGTWAATGVMEGRRLAWVDWCAEELRAELAADPEGARIRSLEAWLAGAVVRGSGEVGLHGLDAPVAARLEVQGLDLDRLPVDLPPLAVGTARASLELTGTLSAPGAEVSVEWVPRTQTGPFGPLRVRAAVADGVLHGFTERLETAAGPVAVEATLPLGALARPEWLWADAPVGPLEVRARAVSLRSAPLVEAMGTGGSGASLTTDLSLDLRWDLADPGRRQAELVLENLVIDSPGESLEAEAPVMAWLDGRQLKLAPLVLEGTRSRVEVDASAVDLETREVYAHAEVTLDASVARLLPVAFQATGPFRLAVDLSGSLDAPSGRLALDHRGGRLVMRDPPVELTDLTFEATLDDGVLSVESGGAGMNRGRLEFGGGWDPASGQGLVLQLENVAFVVAGGMVTRWSGELAVEPEPGRLARVIGELVLDGGIWEQPVDLAGSFLSPSAAPVAADDPTHDILLDLQVRGRGGIRVDNNLGRFEVGWGVLQVRGTAAQPVLEGEVRIAAGGEIALTGKPIEVQRGLIEFTGEPGAEPRIELIPKDDLLQGTGEDFDAEMLARRGLASGLGRVLGLENETLQPAEIAVETETDPGTRFSVGQRISRQIALFFSTDLADPQDRVTTLQVWNLRYLRGLALQAFNESAGQDGFAAVERISWGGTAASSERPVIHKIKLEGDWPLSKRRMRKAAGLDRGEPYEDIFLFVGEVRMEQALAEAGYFDARVDARAEGSESLPTLVFTCEPGPRQLFQFEGDRLSKAARREAVGLYQPPPMEGAALEAIRETLARRLAVDGYPEAEVTAERREDVVVVGVRQGREVKLVGPVVDGVPEEVARDLELAYGGPAQLAELLHEPEGSSPWLERLVHGRGYDRARLSRVWAEPVSEERSVVRLEVDLGPRAVVDGVRLEGSDPLGVVSSPDFRLRPGMPLDRGAVDAAVSGLRRRYLEQGYLGVEAKWRGEEVEPGRWTVTVRVAPGSQRTVERIAFTGLRHLSEDLLRRTLPLRQGDVLDATAVDTGISQLASFAPVERVTATTRPLQGGRTEIEVAVTEKPRWTVGLGVRWGTDTGGELLFDFRDDNLFHRGFSANLRGHTGGDRQYFALITSLPPPPGRRLSLGLTLSYIDEFVTAWVQEKRSRATFDATYGIGRYSTLRGYLGLRRTKRIDDEQFIPQVDLSDFVTLGTQYALDRLDDPFDPRSGFAVTGDLSWNTEISDLSRDYVRSLLGGIVVLEPRSSWAWSQVLRVGVAEPLGGDLLPDIRDARFFAGGQASIRGFPLDVVGPLDFDGDPEGGGALLVLKEELSVPVWKTLRLAVFADSGNVWESWSSVDWGEVVVGAGLGLRLGTPIGPVYVDAAWPVVDPAEVGGSTQYYFGIGRTF